MSGVSYLYKVCVNKVYLMWKVICSLTILIIKVAIKFIENFNFLKVFSLHFELGFTGITATEKQIM